jgi:hypothetical protein
MVKEDSVMVGDESKRVTKLLIPGRPLMLIAALAVVIGLNEALVLQQIHYWVSKSNHFHDGQRWIYNTFAEWHGQFPFWQERTLRRAIKSLKMLRLIRVEQLNKSKCDRTNWYSINYDEVNRLAAEVKRINVHHAQVQTAKATKRRTQRGQFVRVDDHNSSSSLT